VSQEILKAMAIKGYIETRKDQTAILFLPIMFLAELHDKLISSIEKMESR